MFRKIPFLTVELLVVLSAAVNLLDQLFRVVQVVLIVASERITLAGPTEVREGLSQALDL